MFALSASVVNRAVETDARPTICLLSGSQLSTSAESLPNLHRSGLEGGLQKSFQSTTLKVTHSAASTVLANDRNISDVLRTRYVYQILSESVEICTRCGKYLDVFKNVSIIFDWSALTWRRVNDNTLPIF